MYQKVNISTNELRLLVRKMNKIWILMIAALMVIPAAAVITHGANGMTMQGHGGCRVGHFNYTHGFAQGEFVSFNIDSQSGEIQNYEVNGTTVFESVTYENETTGNVWVKGASLFYYGMGAPLNISWLQQPKKSMWRFLHAHDNPAGVLHIVVYGQDKITYKLASGVNAEMTSNHMIMLNGPISGVLIFTGSASISGDQVTVSLGNTNYTFGDYSFRGGSVIFIRTDDWQIPSNVRQKIINGIKDGKVAGQIDISGEGSSDFMNYTYDFHASVSVNMNSISVVVSSENHTGKVVVINVDKNKLQYDENHRIVVKIDGNKAMNTTVTDVLAGGNTYKYAVINGTAEVTIIVYVSHFSSHTLTIESQSIGGSSSGSSSTESSVINWLENPIVITIIVVVIIAIIAAAIIARR